MLGFAKGKAGSRESPGLFSRKSTSTRGCDRRRYAPKDVGPAICEGRGVGVWYGPKENSLRLLSFLGFKAGFLSQAARRSSTVTVVPSACLFQSLDRIIFGMTHTCTKCRAHTSPTVSKPCTFEEDVWLVAGSRLEKSVRSQIRRPSLAVPAILPDWSAHRRHTSRELRESVGVRRLRQCRSLR